MECLFLSCLRVRFCFNIIMLQGLYDDTTLIFSIVGGFGLGKLEGVKACGWEEFKLSLCLGVSASAVALHLRCKFGTYA